MQKQKKAIPVTTTSISKEAISLPIHISGNIVASKESRLSFKTGGIIEKINADAGDEVQARQVLAQLDLKEINEQVRQARVGVEKAERDFRRIENLYKDEVTTLEQFQNAKSALEVARANLNIAEYNLRHSVIHAPTNGIILRKFMEENEITGTGNPIFYFASAEDSWKLTVGVSDKDIVKLKLGDDAEITTDAYPNKPLRGTISKIGNAPDLSTGLYEIELSLENTLLNLKPGFFAKGLIYPSDKIACYKIPIDAAQEGAGNKVIYFTYDENSQKAIKNETEVLFLHNNYLYVDNNSVNENSYVIVDRQKELKHFDKVTATPKRLVANFLSIHFNNSLYESEQALKGYFINQRRSSIEGGVRRTEGENCY